MTAQPPVTMSRKNFTKCDTKVLKKECAGMTRKAHLLILRNFANVSQVHFIVLNTNQLMNHSLLKDLQMH